MNKPEPPPNLVVRDGSAKAREVPRGMRWGSKDVDAPEVVVKLRAQRLVETPGINGMVVGKSTRVLGCTTDHGRKRVYVHLAEVVDESPTRELLFVVVEQGASMNTDLLGWQLVDAIRGSSGHWYVFVTPSVQRYDPPKKLSWWRRFAIKLGLAEVH